MIIHVFLTFRMFGFGETKNFKSVKKYQLYICLDSKSWETPESAVKKCPKSMLKKLDNTCYGVFVREIWRGGGEWVSDVWVNSATVSVYRVRQGYLLSVWVFAECVSVRWVCGCVLGTWFHGGCVRVWARGLVSVWVCGERVSGSEWLVRKW